MDAKIYLQSYGWKEGEALKQGGLKKPILVKHKKDTKGLGHDSNDAEAWWERLFDGQLKNLEVKNGSTGSVTFEQNSESVAKDVRKANSPLYRMFVKGQGLAGTVGKTKHTQVKNTKLDASNVYEILKENFNGDSIITTIESGKGENKKIKKKIETKDKKEKKNEKKEKEEHKEKEKRKDKKTKKDKKIKKEKKTEKIELDKKDRKTKTKDEKIRLGKSGKKRNRDYREDNDNSSSRKKTRS